MQNYINSEIEKLVNEKLDSKEFNQRIIDIVENSKSIRKGEMYMKNSDGSVTLCAKICSICGDNKTPLGKNIYCYAKWFCDLCKDKDNMIT